MRAMRAPSRAPRREARPTDDVIDAVLDLERDGGAACGMGAISLRETGDDGAERSARGALFALDLRAWTFSARTQAVRALGACARDASVDLCVPFRDEYERYCASSRAIVAPRGAAWRAHRLGGWRFDLRALFDAVRARGGARAIDGNAGWRDVAESIGAHGRGCTAGHAARALYERWLAAYERASRAREEAILASEFERVERTLVKEDADVIEALIGLEKGASGDAPARVKVENVREISRSRRDRARASRRSSRAARALGGKTRD